MTGRPVEGNAVIYCEGAFGTTNGKTAHGLVRRTSRYRVLSVVDSSLPGQDAGQLLDGRPSGIPLLASVDEAVTRARRDGTPATHLVVGLAPDGGRLASKDRQSLARAVRLGLNVDCGLHDFLVDDPQLVDLARSQRVTLRDIRRPPPRSALHFFSGKIARVTAPRVAVLGTDSAVGKRTTAWLLVDALTAAGLPAALVGTGQTAWLQGAHECIMLDALVSDFISGEIEHAVWSAWTRLRPAVIVLEGQGSLLNPAYPGGFELLAAARPSCAVLQHAPARQEYDGCPGFALHPLERQIQAIEVVSSRPVAAVTVNHEDLTPHQTRQACARIHDQTGLPAVAPLLDGVAPVVDALLPYLQPGRGADHAA